MRYTPQEDEEMRQALNLILTERRLTRLEMQHMNHGKRLDQIETLVEAARNAAWRLMRGLLMVSAGVLADMHLNGGALLKAFFSGSQ
jgi:hypothetical protein